MEELDMSKLMLLNLDYRAILPNLGAPEDYKSDVCGVSNVPQLAPFRARESSRWHRATVCTEEAVAPD